jgi:hypothetical protein
MGTNKVYSSFDGIIPLMVRRLEKEDYDILLIADGLGQSHNHSNTKGKNDLTKRNLIVELSAPGSASQIIRELEGALRWIICRNPFR